MNLPEPESPVLSALQVAFQLLAQLEQQHMGSCRIPDSVLDLIAALDWSDQAPWN